MTGPAPSGPALSGPAALADRRPAIGLAELTAEAAFQSRVDRKYVVGRRELPGLLDALPHGTRELEIGGRREFGYRSVYLDTDDLAAYHLAGRGRRRRFKVRTRSYLDTGTSFLELKTRGPRGATLKQRIPHPDAEAGDLTSAGRSFLAERLAEARVEVAVASLRPVLATAYVRRTLVLPEATARVTVDTDLAWTSLGGSRWDHRPRDLDRPSLAIVETKSGATPSAVDRLLWSTGHRPARISKYGAGLAALVPGLPDLAWHRALQRHLLT